MPETADNPPETDEKKSRGLGSYVVWAFVAVMVYVLSSGPMLRFGVWGVTRRGAIGPVYSTHGYPSWVQIYTPLAEAYKIRALHRLLGSYWHLWDPMHYDNYGEATPRGIEQL